MRMDKEDISRLVVACHEAGEDLFCVTGVLSVYDTIASLFALPGEPTLLILPGTFAVPEGLLKEDLTSQFARLGFPAQRVCILTDDRLATDVRLLADGDFRSYCETHRISHLLLDRRMARFASI